MTAIITSWFILHHLSSTNSQGSMSSKQAQDTIFLHLIKHNLTGEERGGEGRGGPVNGGHFFARTFRHAHVRLSQVSRGGRRALGVFDDGHTARTALKYFVGRHGLVFLQGSGGVHQRIYSAGGFGTQRAGLHIAGELTRLSCCRVTWLFMLATVERYIARGRVLAIALGMSRTCVI